MSVRRAKAGTIRDKYSTLLLLVSILVHDDYSYHLMLLQLA